MTKSPNLVYPWLTLNSAKAGTAIDCISSPYFPLRLFWHGGKIRTAGAYVDHRIIQTLLDSKLTAGNERGLRHLNPVSIQYSPCNVHKFVRSRYAWLYFFYNLISKHVNNKDFASSAVWLKLLEEYRLLLLATLTP